MPLASKRFLPLSGVAKVDSMQGSTMLADEGAVPALDKTDSLIIDIYEEWFQWTG